MDSIKLKKRTSKEKLHIKVASAKGVPKKSFKKIKSCDNITLKKSSRDSTTDENKKKSATKDNGTSPSNSSSIKSNLLNKRSSIERSYKKADRHKEGIIKIIGGEDDSDEDDVDYSSADEDDHDSESGDESTQFDLGDLPAPDKHSKKLKESSKLTSSKKEEPTGVIYLGRIPHGFYENEMKSYFSQFGTVLRLRLSRNRKNGRSKHYGFVEFQHLEVAKIVAETLDNYLLSGRILSCKLLEKDQIHPKLWIGSEKKFKKDWKPRLARQTHNQEKSIDQQRVISDRLIKREELKRKRFKDLGIDYEFSGFSDQKISFEPKEALSSSREKIEEPPDQSTEKKEKNKRRKEEKRSETDGPKETASSKEKSTDKSLKKDNEKIEDKIKGAPTDESESQGMAEADGEEDKGRKKEKRKRKKSSSGDDVKGRSIAEKNDEDEPSEVTVNGLVDGNVDDEGTKKKSKKVKSKSKSKSKKSLSRQGELE